MCLGRLSKVLVVEINNITSIVIMENICHEVALELIEILRITDELNYFLFL